MACLCPPWIGRLIVSSALVLILGGADAAAAGLQNLLEKAASAEGPKRPAAIHEFLDAVQKSGDLALAEQLRYAWYGYFLAETDAEKLKLIEIAGKISSPDARMILLGLTDTASIGKQVAAGQQALDQLLVDFPGAKKDPAGRLTFGQNPYDKMAAYERFLPPPAWVGRWGGEGIELDLNAYPSATIAGRLRRRMDGKVLEFRVIGFEEAGRARILGAVWQAEWQGDHFVLSCTGAKGKLSRVAVGKIGKAPPPDAKILFDGRDMKAWTGKAGGEAAWKITPEGWMEIPPGVGNHRTRESFGDVRLYLEYRHAYNRDGINRKRGNSGVYLQSNYEIQLNDNFGNEVNKALSGAIYHLAVPAVNASAPPMEWQSLEAEFFAPRFDAAGKKTANARMSVWQNGVKIHDNVELPKITGGGTGETAEPLPINLQAHGGLLQFRNIWVQALP